MTLGKSYKIHKMEEIPVGEDTPPRIECGQGDPDMMAWRDGGGGVELSGGQGQGSEWSGSRASRVRLLASTPGLWTAGRGPWSPHRGHQPVDAKPLLPFPGSPDLDPLPRPVLSWGPLPRCPQPMDFLTGGLCPGVEWEGKGLPIMHLFLLFCSCGYSF